MSLPPAPIVILGSGLAGTAVARELRKLDREVPVLLLSADAGDFYAKPNLSNALAQGRTSAQLVTTPRAALATQLNIEIRPHTMVTGLQPSARLLQTASGAIAYSQLVLAVGAQPIRLPIDGDGAAEVLSVNHLDDYAVFRQRLDGRRRIALLGAGLIGCEFANDLVGAGYEVDVFDLAPQPLGRLLPADTAAYFRRGLEAAGVRFHFGGSIARVDKRAGGYGLVDGAGAELETDLVVSAVGLRAETALAKAAGLTINRGIVVGATLASSDAAIFAVGDCAEVQGLSLPFVLPIMQQARALARTLAGTPTPVVYPAMPVVVKTPACPTVVCPPPAGASGIWRETQSATGARALFEDDAGAPLGFALLGDALREKQALAATMPPWL